MRSKILTYVHGFHGNDGYFEYSKTWRHLLRWGSTFLWSLVKFGSSVSENLVGQVHDEKKRKNNNNNNKVWLCLDANTEVSKRSPYQNSGMSMQVSSLPTNSSLQNTPRYQFSLKSETINNLPILLAAILETVAS